MEKFQELFDSFSNYSVLIIGDVMVDAYLWGKVERISPEAPVPIVSVEKCENRMGGAANVALNIKALGAKPILCSIIGDDENGRIFLDLLEEQGMPNLGIICDKDRKTTTKTRVISGNQHCLRIDDEITSSVSEKQEETIVQQIDTIINEQKINAIIFEDYDKGVISPNIIKAIVSIAAKKQIPISVDPKKRNFLDYKGVTLFKPNFKELCEGLKVEIKKNDFLAIHQNISKFRHDMSIRHLMVTLSELGMIITDGDSFYHVPTHIREVADVSGAGDTVISVATLCLIAGLDATEIARISNIAGGLVCEHAGVVPVDKLKLLQEISR
jgi:D-glycero-beta-D-manno-heptose-7-phosphate kinase